VRDTAERPAQTAVVQLQGPGCTRPHVRPAHGVACRVWVDEK